MAKTDEVRADIERVRGDLGSTLEEIGERASPKKVVSRAKAEVADKVSPGRVVRRRSERLRQGLRVAKESVLGGDDGSDSDAEGSNGKEATMTSATRRSNPSPPARTGASRASGRLSEAGSDVASRARSAPRAVQDRAQGNPLAAGLVAFGAGVAVALILPPSEAERRAVGQAKQRIEPLKQRVVETGRTVAGELQPVAQAGVERVKERATTAAQELKGQAQGAAQEVKGQAQTGAQEVKGSARSGVQDVKGEATGAARQVKAQARGTAKAVKGQARGTAKAAKGQAKATPRRAKATATDTAKASPRPRRAKAASGPSRAGSGASGPTTSAPE